MSDGRNCFVDERSLEYGQVSIFRRLEFLQLHVRVLDGVLQRNVEISAQGLFVLHDAQLVGRKTHDVLVEIGSLKSGHESCEDTFKLLLLSPCLLNH